MKSKYFILGFVIVFILISIVGINGSLFGKSLTGNSIENIGIKNISLDKQSVKLDNEVVSKRTYNSQTFKNPDGTFTTTIGSNEMFFFDGEQFVELNKLSSPFIEKKEITFYSQPESNLIDFGSYELYPGVTPSIENYELVLRDGNNKSIVSLPRPHSWDALGDEILNEYVIDFNDRDLQVWVDVDPQWLENAEYPIVVDPTVVLDNSTGVYEGLVSNNSGSPSVYNRVQSDNNNLVVGNLLLTNYLSFIEFNFSSIPQNSDIEEVFLNLTIDNDLGSRAILMNISRFNGTRFSNNITYPTNNSGNRNLFEDVLYGRIGGFYVTELGGFENIGEEKSINLTTDAADDFENQLSSGFFSVGLGVDSLYDNNLTTFNSSDNLLSNSRPKLIVTYSSGCTYSGIGNWEINTTCHFRDQNITVNGDLYIYSNSNINMSSTTIINFSGINRNIYVYSGANISLNDTASFGSI